MSDTENPPIVVENVTEVTPHNKALYETGKSLLIDSITTGREFCKFMITVSTSAIPIHLGLLKFVLPEKYTLTFNQGIMTVIPAVIFLIASIVFTIGYYPQIGKFSLDITDEIENERNKTIKRRKDITIWGFVIFIIATLAMIFCLTFFLTDLNKNAS
jgi:formate hydrogenlyase subunit 3/multisubunit Na+/H+ antiporter MnhD subunit